jgi:hypothetical protein
MRGRGTPAKARKVGRKSRPEKRAMEEAEAGTMPGHLYKEDFKKRKGLKNKIYRMSNKM